MSAEVRHPTFDAVSRRSEDVRQMTDSEVGMVSERNGLYDPAAEEWGEPASSRMRLVLAIALGSIIVGGSVDLFMDQPLHWLSFHVIFEVTMLAGALVMATTLWLSWWRSEQAAAGLRAALEARNDERDEWRATAQHALDGLGRAIDAQFIAWRLTPTEREVALLLLKGYGHKQIAALTDRSERTVRQHAGVVYDKSGLGGRAELSAFFLQDLMLPGSQREALAVNRDTA